MSRNMFSVTVKKDPMVDGYFTFDLTLRDDAWITLGDKNEDALENLETYIYQSLRNLGAGECHTNREDREYVAGAIKAGSRSKEDIKQLVEQAWKGVAALKVQPADDADSQNSAAKETYNELYAAEQKKRREEYQFFKDYRPYIGDRPDLKAPFTHVGIKAVQPQKAGGLSYDEDSHIRERGLTVRDLIKEDALVVSIDVEHPSEKALRSICEQAVFVPSKNSALAANFGMASRKDPDAFRLTAVMRRTDLNALISKMGAALEIKIPPVSAGPHSHWDDVRLKQPVQGLKVFRLKES